VSGTLSVLAQNACGQSAPVSVVINQHLQSSTTLSVTSCDPFSFNGQNYAQSGSYVYAGQTIHGCDSTVTLNLTIVPTIQTTINENACGSFPWNGQSLWTSGVYIDSLQSAAGCDSVVVLNLNVYPIDAIVMDSTVLDIFTWNGIDYLTSGTYTQFFTSINGCDSSVTINLTIEDSGLESLTSSFKISPNPLFPGTILNIHGIQSSVPYAIITLDGAVIQKGETEGAVTIQKELTPGSYFLKIQGQSIPILILK
jgi:hypothetical protein